MKQGKRISAICLNCGQPFEAYIAETKRGNGKYCSRKCAGIAIRRKSPNTRISSKVDCNCIRCGKQFKINPRFIKSNGNYCTNKCHNLYQAEQGALLKQSTCLQCGKLFKSQSKGVKGRSQYCSYKCLGLSKRKRVDCICEQCGKPFQVIQSEIKHGIGKYCSLKCKGKAQSQSRSIERVCLYCGTKFSRPAGFIKASYGMYCSQICAGKAHTTKIEKICICGKHFFVKKSHVTRRKYCSKECQNREYVKLYAGENNPAWRGGSGHYRGLNWHQQRKQAYERDGGECQICHYKPKPNQKKCAVHHIKPFREFDGNYILANDLLNLITLCEHCHPKAEHGFIPVPKRLL